MGRDGPPLLYSIFSCASQCPSHYLTWVLSLQQRTGSSQEQPHLSPPDGNPYGRFQTCLTNVSQEMNREDFSPPSSQNLHAGSSTRLIACMCRHKVLGPVSSPVITLPLFWILHLRPHFSLSCSLSRNEGPWLPETLLSIPATIVYMVDSIVHLPLDRLERKTHCGLWPH